MLHELIKSRRSWRVFSAKPIEAEKLDSLFEAARWAASSMNEQPWRFIYRTKENLESYNELFNTLMDGNKKWAGTAPVLIAVVAKTHFDYKDRQNRHALYDTGQAVANMMIQATHLRLVAHQMGGFHMAQAKKALAIDDSYELLAIIAIGYSGDINTLPADILEREKTPRKRMELSDFVSKERMI